jgi:hypothetical protein
MDNEAVKLIFILLIIIFSAVNSFLKKKNQGKGNSLFTSPDEVFPSADQKEGEGSFLEDFKDIIAESMDRPLQAPKMQGRPPQRQRVIETSTSSRGDTTEQERLKALSHAENVESVFTAESSGKTAPLSILDSSVKPDDQPSRAFALKTKYLQPQTLQEILMVREVLDRPLALRAPQRYRQYGKKI